MQPGQNKKDSPGNASNDYSRDNSQFLNNAQKGSAKTKSNLIEVPSVTLPKGGGALKSIDEKFSVNASNGTAAYSVPLPWSKGRNGFTPSLSLNYNSGGGNSIFGIGWGLDLPSIQRKTDKKLPEYKDAEESDIFIFSGAEDLVPELKKNESGDWVKHKTTNGNITVTRYRPRIEGGFSRIEKVEVEGNVYWRMRTKENVVSVFGISDSARLYSPVPGEQDKISAWNLEYVYDDKGNLARYYYKKETGVDTGNTVYEKNRRNGLAPFTNVYLKGVKYGNRNPYYEGNELPEDFLFELVLDYGEHHAEFPTPAEQTSWSLRKDLFSDYKPGFEVRTYRLCKRMLMFHRFAEELGLDNYLVRSLAFEYDEQPAVTYLEKVTSTGYIWNTDGTLRSQKSLPPIEFSYFKPGFSTEVKEITPENIVHAPVGLDDLLYQWTDLHSEGVPGILSEQGGGWYYKENLGNGEFAPAQLITPRPTLTGLAQGTLSIQELEGDGDKYLVSNSGVLKGYFGMNAEETWQPFHPFESFPNIDFKDPELKFLDLNGDGKPDLLFSHEQNFIWYGSKGKEGYDDYRLAGRAADEEKGPVIFFSGKDEKMLVGTADMNGDGLSDIVLVTHAGVSYYPNLGYGKFGARVSMQMEGNIDSFDQFNPDYIHLADIDGTGTTDIVYIGKAAIQVWFNQSGNSLSAPSEIFNPFPELDNQSKISVIDLLGNGTSCLVWSSPLPKHSHAPLRYIDMMGGKKPHVMVGHKNNMGKEVALEYRSSTYYYLKDKKEGKKWITKLPFPVQCVNRVIMEDKVSRSRYVNEYSYHHGFYDPVEREFRGFALVVQKDTEQFDHYVKQTQAAGAVNAVEEDLFQPSLISKTWFHTGACLNRDKWFHQLDEEYYPNALIRNGQISDPSLIAVMDTYRLQETSLPPDLTREEYMECCRALKGLVLRKEVYSDEGSSEQQIHPYTVSQENYEIQMLQPRNGQRYAVFFSHVKEKLEFNYERDPVDPRILHSLNTLLDKYGNVLESASVMYGRKNAETSLPSDEDRARQSALHITYSQSAYTEVIDTAEAYRLPVLCEAMIWEIKTGVPSDVFFTPDEIRDRFINAGEKAYEDDTPADGKRKLEHSRTLFLRNDLSGPMPLGTIDTLGLPDANFLLAFTPSMLEALYPGKWSDELLRNEGRYVHSEGDNNYWIRSGRVYFHPDLTASPAATSIAPATPADVDFARNNFYLPVAYEDNFQNLSKVFYDGYKLNIVRTVDPLINETTIDGMNYRTLSPYLIRDMNGNRSAVRFDALGLVTHTFVLGKAGAFKGDRFDEGSAELSEQDQAASVVEYDFRYYASNGALPNKVTTFLRENHFYRSIQPGDLPGGVGAWLEAWNNGTLENNTPVEDPLAVIQVSYSYCDGSGKEVLKKIQAEPGPAPQRDAEGNLVRDTSGNPVTATTSPELRWIGNGRTVFNNKGNPVKQYEPFFDSSPEYNTEEELTLLGHTSLLYYDALSRMIKTVHPDKTISAVEFNAWMKKDYDRNDNVLQSDWYISRIGGSAGPEEQMAAQQTEVHANTPMVTWLDSLGRPFLAVAHNRMQRSGEAVAEEFYHSRTHLDIEGNARSVQDARGNQVMSWMYDMLGNICYQLSMDGGERRMLADASGKPLRLWDSRMQTFSYEYDPLRRPLAMIVDTGEGNKVFEKYEYGEGIAGAQAKNLRGKLYRQYDTAGRMTVEAYDFKGNVLVNSRQLHADYHLIPDWNANPSLENETFLNGTNYDAMNRPLQMIAPDNSVFIPQFNEANLLNSVDIRIKGSPIATNFVSDIEYNAKGQRTQIYYGNGTVSRYEYQEETFRLTRLLTTADNGAVILQDLRFTYDPSGNIIRQFDNAQKTVFYGGQQVEAHSSYLYDAIYRLIESNGREHAGQVGTPAGDNWNDSWSRLLLQPDSPVQMREYTQKYFYDAVGNISEMRHIAGTGSWTRTYEYETGNNHLIRTSVGSQDYIYTYSPHGSLMTVPHLQDEIDWNFREEMQHIRMGGGGEAWYVYDCQGQRIRKVIERPGNKTEERIYLGPFEIYRERTNGDITLERETLHVMDDKQRIAMIDTRTQGNDGSVAQLQRYQYGNHIGSSCLELDEEARIISYEEYHPFGTSAYQATDASRQVPARRYRYTGMERDDETGFNYHAARYYMPWLGRWTAADPIGIGDGLNIYAYVKNNPVCMNDPSGKGGPDPPVEITNPEAREPQPRYPQPGVPSPHPDGGQRALPPPGQGAEVNADIALPDLHLSGRSRFSLLLGQPEASDPSRRGFYLTGDFTLTYPGIPSAVPLHPRIEGDFTATGTTSADAVGETVADPTRSLSGFTGNFSLTGSLEGVPLVSGRLSLAGDVTGPDRPTFLRFDARVGLFADTPFLPHVRFTGAGTAQGDSVSMAGTFSGWGPGITFGNWDYTRSGGLNLHGNYIGLQFGPLGLGSINPRLQLPTTRDGSAPFRTEIPGGLPREGVVDVFSPGLSVGYNRFFVNPHRGTYWMLSVGYAWNATVVHHDISRQPLDVPIVGSFLQDLLNYHPTVGTPTPTGSYFGLGFRGNF